jgi:hypothetical protein
MKPKKQLIPIEKYGPCALGLKRYNSQPDSQTALKTCQQGSELIWFAYRVGLDEKKCAKVLYKIMQLIEHLMEDKRSVAVIGALEKFSRGEIGGSEMGVIAKAANTAAKAADYAAKAADYAAKAADYAAKSAIALDAAAAIALDAAAADAANYAANYDNFESQTADICREILGEYFMAWIETRRRI